MITNATCDDHVKNIKFKTEWSIKDIMKYINDVRLECQLKNHDGLIFIISCHGTTRNMILTSNYTKFELNMLFDHFNGNSCRYLIDKPKIFIIDSCRGNQIAQPININYGGKYHQEEKKKTETIKLKKIDNESNDLYFHCDANFCVIFANTEGYATADGNINGGFLIRSVKKVFNQSTFVEKHNLDDIIKQIRIETKSQATIINQKFKELQITQMVENRSTMEANWFFQQHN